MNTKIIYFIGGVLSGCLGTYFALKNIMQKRIDAEVADVKEAYASRNSDKPAGSVDEKPIKTHQEAKDIAAKNSERKAELAKYRSLAEDSGYVNTHKTEYNLFSNPPKAREIKNGIDDDEDLDIIDTTPDKDAKGPYVLETDESSSASEKFVNEEPYFDKITLFLYDDGVLCTEFDEIITDLKNTIGADSLKRIGEYEPDVVYVRNEKTSTDYEVIRQYRDFADIPDDGS